MQVTELKKLSEGKYVLYTDYEPYSVVYTSDIRRLKLIVGDEVDTAVLDNFRKEYLYKRAMNRAVGCIKCTDKCEAELRKKLKEYYCDQDIIDATMNKLKEYGYIDDLRYSRAYIRSRINKKGINVISYELIAKGVPGDIIDEAISQSDIPDEKGTIMRVLERRYDVHDCLEKRDRIIAFFLRKGFKYRDIKLCIDEYTGV